MLVDGMWIGVEIHELSAALYDWCQRIDLVGVDGQQHSIGSRPELDRGFGPSERYYSPIGGLGGVLDARYGVGGKEAEKLRDGEGRSILERETQGAVTRWGATSQLGGRDLVDLLDRLVEGANTGETRRVSDVGDGHVALAEKLSCETRPSRAGYDAGGGAHFGFEDTLQMTLRYTETARQPGNPVDVGYSFSDEAKPTTHEVGAGIPFSRVGTDFGATATARPITGKFGDGRITIERSVVPSRRRGRTDRPAIDARGLHRHEEPTIETTVPAVHRLVHDLEVHTAKVAAVVVAH